jgi:lactate dehydrogenase-like 2-hydroxyacid dehydrogenase
MSGRRVALLGALPDDQRAAFERALPEGWSAAEGGEALLEAEVAVVRDGGLDVAMLDEAPRLRRIVKIDVGAGSIDTSACEARGIAIELVQSPALNSVAEHAVMVILMLLKQPLEAAERLRAGRIVGGVEPAVTTQESYAYNWVGLEHFDALYGKTVGLVGLGRIGSHAATILRGFGCDVVYTKRDRLDTTLEEQLGVRYLPFEELLTVCECVSLHLRFVAETERLMGEREFGLMRPGSLFVNTARGRLVDEAALIAALESGHLAGAALDVFWYEPLPADSPLLSAPNLVLTPHTGGIPLAESQVLELQEAARRVAA